MTKDDILLRLAREADLWMTSDERIAAVERFADLVAEQERERCAEVCEREICACCWDDNAQAAAEHLAAVIREQKP